MWGQETWSEALRRINEGAAMIRCKGEAGILVMFLSSGSY